MKLFTTTLAVATLAFTGLAAADSAQDFTFTSSNSGDGSLEWEFNFEESTETTVESGAEFAFNGGAGSNGEATADGEYALVGGVFGEMAGGQGNAYSNTNGANFAQASFTSGSFAANGGITYDETFGVNAAEISFSGLVTAGGAGSVDTGLTTGAAYTYQQTGSGSYEYSQNNSASQTATP